MTELKSARRGRFRLAFRIAARDALQHKGRSLLVVALIALPVVGLSAIATVATSKAPTAAETARNDLGSTQAELTVVGGPNAKLEQYPTDPAYFWVGSVNNVVGDSGTEPTALPSAYLPAGTRILELRSVSLVAKTAGGLGGLEAVQGQAWDRSFAGRYEVLSGHRPTSADQIMATPAALTRLGASIGSTVEVVQPRTLTFTIVGTMRDRTLGNSSQQLFTQSGAVDGEAALDAVRSTIYYLPDTALSWAKVQQLNHDGITVLSREVLLDPPVVRSGFIDSTPNQLAQSAVVLLPLIGFTLFEVALLAGAAFMVGTKQQQRALATLASVGGDRRMLARVVSCAGIVLGLAGGLIGTGLGLAAAAVYLPLGADGSLSAYPGFHVNGWALAAIVAFAVFAGWISALIPARTASKVDVVAALRGAVRPGKPSRKTPVIGIVIAIVGVAITVAGVFVALAARAQTEQLLVLAQIATTLIVVGPILLQIAALVVAPLVLRAVARVLSRLGTGARLASRDAARNASRSVPAVGAIMSTIFVASFLMTYLAAVQAQDVHDWEYGTPVGVLSASAFGGAADDTASSDPATDRAHAAALAQAMESISGKSGAVTLSQTKQLGEKNAPDAVFPVALVDPTTRCETLATGPAAPKSMLISDNDCGGPSNLAFPRIGYQVWVGSDRAIEIATGASLSSAARTTLASGGVVAFEPHYVTGGEVTFAWLTAKQLQMGTAVTTVPGGDRSISLPATVQNLPKAMNVELAMSPAGAKAAGLDVTPQTVLLHTGVAPTDEQRDALVASAQAIYGVPDLVGIGYSSGPPSYAGVTAWILLGLCGVIALGAAGVALGLARSDGRRNEAVLGSLGAPPRLRRSFAFWSGIVVTGVGAIGGVALGTVPAIAAAQAFVAPVGHAAAPFSLPWVQLVATAIGLPLVLAAASWLSTGRNRIAYNQRAPIG